MTMRIYIAIGLLFVIGYVAGVTLTWLGTTTKTLDASVATACDPGSLLIQLRASFSDNFLVSSYAIQSQNPDGGFSIGQAEYLQCEINKITAPSYTITILVTSDGNHQATQDLTITATNLPILTFVSPTGGHNYAIQEDTAGAVDIGTLSASKGATTTGFTFSLLTNVPQFQVVGDKLQTSAGANLDVDATGAASSYSLQLRVTDGSSNVDISVTVSVSDVNDNTPVITGDSKVEVRADAKAGDAVYTVPATDADKTSPNNVITFSIDDSTYVTVNVSTGVLSLVMDFSAIQDALPGDQLANYAFTITATDHGTGPRSATKTYSLSEESSGGKPLSASVALIAFASAVMVLGML